MAARALSLMFVSIHAPLARSNRNTPLKNVRFVFQYMLLLRGATRTYAMWTYTMRFNTCSSCEEQQNTQKKTR